MAKWMYVAADISGESINDPGTEFVVLSGSLGPSSTESDSQFAARGAYTASELYIRVTANTFGSVSTLRMRIGGADGNLVASIPASSTGEFEDLVNTDAIADGDLINYEIDAVGMHGSAMTFDTFMVTMENIIDNRCQVASSSNPPSTLGQGATGFFNAFGELFFLTIGGNPYSHDGDAGQLSNMQLNVVSNNTDNASTLTSVINGVDANMSVSVPANSTGLFEDAVNSDDLGGGAQQDFEIRGDAGAGMAGDFIQQSLISTTWDIQGGRPWGLRERSTQTDIAFGQTLYYPLEGSSVTPVNSSTTEGNVDLPARFPLITRNLVAAVAANNLNAASTLEFRVNAADSGLGVSIPSTSTGFFRDLVDEIAVEINDDINYEVDTSGGTSGNLNLVLFWAEMQQPDDMPWDFAQPPGISRKVEVLAY